MSEDEKNNWEKRYSGDGCEPRRDPVGFVDRMGG